MSTIAYESRENVIHDAFAAPVPLAEEEEFPHGWRRITETLPDGSVRYHDIPLTPEDFLNPQPGDQMPQSPEHAKELMELYCKLVRHFAGNPRVEVLSDVKMRWGTPGLKEPFPDIAIIPDIRDREKIGSSFDVVEQGTRPCLIIEIMSPNYSGDDTHKVDIYEKAGVHEYLILNHHPEDKSIPFELTGYHMVRGRYRPMVPDRNGRLSSKTTGIWFSLGEGGREMVLTNADTGEQLLPNVEEYYAHLEAVARADRAEAEIRRLRAELARLHCKE